MELSCTHLRHRLSQRFPPFHLRPTRSSASQISIVMASNRSRRTGGHGHGHGSGSLVDENMIVLRNRIHELQLAEKKRRPPPDGWMDSEWRYYCSSYGADVCDAVGILQSILINTRPGVSVAVGLLFALYLPVSAVFISVHLLEALRSALH